MVPVTTRTRAGGASSRSAQRRGPTGAGAGGNPLGAGARQAGLVDGAQALAEDVTEHFAHRGRRVGRGRQEAFQGAGRNGYHRRCGAGDVAAEGQLTPTRPHMATEGLDGTGRADEAAGLEYLALGP